MCIVWPRVDGGRDTLLNFGTSSRSSRSLNIFVSLCLLRKGYTRAQGSRAEWSCRLWPVVLPAGLHVFYGRMHTIVTGLIAADQCLRWLGGCVDQCVHALLELQLQMCYYYEIIFWADGSLLASGFCWFFVFCAAPASRRGQSYWWSPVFLMSFFPACVHTNRNERHARRFSQTAIGDQSLRRPCKNRGT